MRVNTQNPAVLFDAWNEWSNTKQGVAVRIWDGSNVSAPYELGDIAPGKSSQLELPADLYCQQAYITWTEVIGGVTVDRAAVAENSSVSTNNFLVVRWVALDEAFNNVPPNTEWVNAYFAQGSLGSRKSPD